MEIEYEQYGNTDGVHALGERRSVIESEAGGIKDELTGVGSGLGGVSLTADEVRAGARETRDEISGDVEEAIDMVGDGSDGGGDDVVDRA